MRTYDVTQVFRAKFFLNRPYSLIYNEDRGLILKCGLFINLLDFYNFRAGVAYRGFGDFFATFSLYTKIGQDFMDF